MREKIASNILRIALGVVFLAFGIGKFQNDIWAQTIRNMGYFSKLPWDVGITVFLIGISETVTGAFLIFGICTRFFALVASLQLVAILVLLRFQEVRDIGLLGAAIFIALSRYESYGILQLVRRGRHKV